MAVVCSTLLKTLDAALRDRIERNRTYDRKKNVVLVFVGRDKFGKLNQGQIEKVYEERVEETRTGDGAIAYYTYVDPASKRPLAYAFPLEGMGLWDKVRGLMAVETDLNTIRAVSFYDQAETPGLGGRIGEVAWVSQFGRTKQGRKTLKNSNGQVAIHILKAGTKDREDLSEYEIDGITAATMTCDAVNRLMRDSIKRFLERVKVKK